MADATRRCAKATPWIAKNPGVGPVNEHRLYFMDATGHVRRAVELEGADDDEAIALAAQYVDDEDLELWQRGRMVKKIPARLSRTED
jgi:hypothetical protein